MPIPEASSNFPALAAGQDRDRLLRAIARLTAEIDGSDKAGAPIGADQWREQALFVDLSDADEALVRELGESLARLASASSTLEPAAAPPSSAVSLAIGGAEILMRSELITGRGEQLERLLPGFAYMVTLPYVGQAKALSLSRRTADLLELSSASS
jgi:hypothetical protein